MKTAALLALLASAGLVSSIIAPIHRRQSFNPSPLTSTQNGVTFEVEIQINNQTFYVIPDTGSSDLWVPVADFQCVDPASNNEIPQEECHFASTYQVPNSTETEYVANKTFGVQYGTGIALGKVAYTDGLPDVLTGGVRQITLMTLTVDGITWGSSLSTGSHTTNSTPFQAVVDTGNHLNLLPTALAEAVNNAFSPPGAFDAESRLYNVDCNATTPEFGVVLDGQTFWHLSEDLIYRRVDGSCFSSVAPTAEGDGVGLNFLGDAFLRNVVSVFDFGREEMRFASRVYNSPNPTPTYSSGAISGNNGTEWWCAILLLFMTMWCF
ncbi:hypothetical protein N8I77_006940 [Diaporthe amygdali]|uniref:Peptidase A1 domain-containing protein n=1 Tax=Phomopsis amygdali TaxID=1214568 RepID=A0AAD9SHM1_PHOAM|nr:hypothetical protein N8I77_006940 [Diaporthe amygdali]